MSENILSLEDLRFLENLYFKQGVQFLRVDEDGIKVDDQIIAIGADSKFDINYLSEIAKKMKFRLNSNFQLNISNGFNLHVVRL